jgi:hypothetical protein
LVETGKFTVSTDPSNEDNGASAAISIVFILGTTFYISNQIQICGRNKAQDMAKAIFSEQDRPDYVSGSTEVACDWFADWQVGLV